MTLTGEVQDQIRRFVDGLVDADDLSDWLDANAGAIHASGDDALVRLVGLTFSLLEDVFQGHRTRESAAAILSDELPMVAAFKGFMVIGETRVVVMAGKFEAVTATGT